jgi:hypothetical protein
MWYSTHSTGIKQFDDDHQKIDSFLVKFAQTSDPIVEQKLLQDLYSALEIHIKNKKQMAGFEYLPDAEMRDIFLLQGYKRKIAERENGGITKLTLIRDLHQMLADHVFKISKS